MKKFLSILLVCTMMLALVGCTGGGTKKNDDPYYLHINYGWGKNYANEAYILSGNKNYTDDAGNYSKGKLWKYNITYATLTYPSERFW